MSTPLHSMEQPETPPVPTPGDFIAKWRTVEFKERAAAQEQSRWEELK